MNHQSSDQSWGHRGGRDKRMMPPRRKTAFADVANIGLQASKGFHLGPTPKPHPMRQQSTTSSTDGMKPQMVAATTPKGDNQSGESTGRTHQRQCGGEAEGRHLPRLHNNVERNDARKRHRCWPSTALDRTFAWSSWEPDDGRPPQASTDGSRAVLGTRQE